MSSINATENSSFDKIRRCSWVKDLAIEQNYHDLEWGVPLRDDRKLFEMLNLEGMQAGLSWLTVLTKREEIQKAFDYFDPEKIILYDDKKVEALLKNPGIIRNKLKVRGVIQNAKNFKNVVEEHGSFSHFIWQYVDNKPIVNHWRKMEDVPTTTEISDRMSKDMKKRGFKFVGPTIMYSFMQAVGMVNDHLYGCFKYEGQTD